jgi:hypothetical protein
VKRGREKRRRRKTKSEERSLSSRESFFKEKTSFLSRTYLQARDVCIDIFLNELKKKKKKKKKLHVAALFKELFS